MISDIVKFAFGNGTDELTNFTRMILEGKIGNDTVNALLNRVLHLPAITISFAWCDEITSES